MTTVAQGITRFDYKNTHGYFVRYMRDKARFQKLFSDGVYGSKEKALQEASEYLQKLKEAFPPMNRREFCQIRRGLAKDGVVGVYRQRGASKGHYYEMWIAEWSPQKGVYKHKTFSVHKYGEEEAKRMAIETRMAGLREMELSWPDGYREYVQRQEQVKVAVDRFRRAAFDSDPFAYEGAPKYRAHIERERDKGLRKKLLERFLEAHGNLYCEICMFSFEDEYGLLGEGLIEVHHKKPLASLKENEETSLGDLILICSNCHYVIHSGDPSERLATLQSLFVGSKVRKKANDKAFT